MGFFNNLFGGAKDLNKVANAVKMVKSILNTVEYEPDDMEYLFAAWICRVGIIDIVEKNNWPMTYKVTVIDKGAVSTMTLFETHAMTIGRLTAKVEEIDDDEIKDAVDDILKKGDMFYTVNNKVPEDTKKIFK